MTCYFPVHGWRAKNGSGQIVSNPKRGWTDLPASRKCGHCKGCRYDRAGAWAIRCMHEASLHAENSFITLTYRPADLPYPPSLNRSTFQKFMKRLRKRFSDKRIRFYHCGEYGSQFGRPHYHAIIFGLDFPDKRFLKRDKKTGDVLYTSKILDELWGLGFASIGSVTYNSASYVARYVVDKINGDLAQIAYEWTDPETGEIFQKEPEYSTMSLKPGIAADWFEKYSGDVFPNDFVIVKGREAPVPKYYSTLYERAHEAQFQKIKSKRIAKSLKFRSDNTKERLAVKHEVFLSKVKQLKRSLK